MRYSILALLVVAISCSALMAQTDQPDPYKGIDWQPNFDKALAKAKKEKRPIMVAFVLRGESANESICADHFVDSKLIKLSREFVCVLAYAEQVYGDNADDTSKSDAYVRSFSHRISKKQRIALELDARSEYLEAGQASAPQFIFVHPDGETILLRHIWLLSVSELRDKMHRALNYYDPNYKLPSGLAEQAKSNLDLVDRLLVEANGNNMSKRRDAMSLVAVKDHPKVIEFLIKQTGKDLDQSRRLEAIRAMGQEGQVKYLPQLHKLLKKERGFQVRTNVAEALGDIGLVESVKPILDVLKKEKKKQLRSILIQSLMKCGGQHPDVTKALAKILRTGGDLDRITILYRLANGTWDETFTNGLGKCLKSSNASLRAAAYYAIGSHKLAKHRKKVKGRFSSEKAIARNACGWALNELGDTVAGDTESPSGKISGMLPSASY